MIFKKIFFSLMLNLGCYTASVMAFEAGMAEESTPSAKQTTIIHYTIPSHFAKSIEHFFYSKEFRAIFSSLIPDYHFSRSKIERIFFDTGGLNLLNQGNYLAKVTIVESSKPVVMKHFISLFLNGQEFVFENRNSSKVVSPDDKHQLLGRIKRIERALFGNKLKQASVQQKHQLHPVVKLTTHSLTQRINVENIERIGITANVNDSVILGKEGGFVDIILESNWQNMDDRTSQRLQNAMTILRQYLEKYFSGEVIKDSTPYQIAVKQQSIKQPFLLYFLDNKRVFKILQMVFFSLLGFLLIALMLQRKKRKVA